MIDQEDMRDAKRIRRFMFGTFVTLLIITGGAAITSSLFELAWFPWDVKMKTAMIRNSNSYVTTQQAALREMRTNYEYAQTPEQKAALVNQMTAIADLVPDQVPPDIQVFLASHR